MDAKFKETKLAPLKPCESLPSSILILRLARILSRCTLPAPSSWIQSSFGRLQASSPTLTLSARHTSWRGFYRYNSSFAGIRHISVGLRTDCRYKVQPGTNDPVDREKFRRLMKTVAFNGLFISPIVLYANFHALQWRGHQGHCFNKVALTKTTPYM